MFAAHAAVTNHLTLAQTLDRITASPTVDGLALFGSRVMDTDNPVSDYDLLILVNHRPIDIFQMFTYIDGRMADIVIVPVEAADQVLQTSEPVTVYSQEGMLLHKMQDASVHYDASGRLTRVQQHLHNHPPLTDFITASTPRSQYETWFWLNHTLCHVHRMLQSGDPVYETAVDLMLLGALAEIPRAYYQIRQLIWAGQKDAMRYLEAHDMPFLTLLREAIQSSDRVEKGQLYQKLVATVLAPVGGILDERATIIYLRDGDRHPEGVKIAQEFWKDLVRLDNCL